MVNFFVGEVHKVIKQCISNGFAQHNRPILPHFKAARRVRNQFVPMNSTCWPDAVAFLVWRLMARPEELEGQINDHDEELIRSIPVPRLNMSAAYARRVEAAFGVKLIGLQFTTRGVRLVYTGGATPRDVIGPGNVTFWPKLLPRLIQTPANPLDVPGHAAPTPVERPFYPPDPNPNPTLDPFFHMRQEWSQDEVLCKHNNENPSLNPNPNPDPKLNPKSL